MAEQSKNPTDLKPGSSTEDAKALSGEHDFGVPESNTVGRAYTSANTKAADHGAAQVQDFEHKGKRDHGVGGRDSGPGSSSGGDIDTDFVGLGGVGLATNIDKPAPDGSGRDARDTDGSSDNAASGGHAKGENQTLVGQVGGRHEQINVVTTPDARTLDVGADGVSNTGDTEIDDSFRGEISSAEASGRDDRGV